MKYLEVFFKDLLGSFTDFNILFLQIKEQKVLIDELSNLKKNRVSKATQNSFYISALNQRYSSFLMTICSDQTLSLNVCLLFNIFFFF